MAHRHPYITYDGSSSDEAWTRNPGASIRPSRRIALSSSEGEESDARHPAHRRNYFFGRANHHNISSDSDRYHHSSSEYESSDNDVVRRVLPPPRSARGFYNTHNNNSDSEEDLTEDEEGPEYTKTSLWKKIRPRSILGAVFALGLAISLPFLMDRSLNTTTSLGSMSIPKVSKLPRYIADSLYYTASSLVPGSTRRMGGIRRPAFVYEHPYASSSYYTSTNDTKVLIA